LILTSETQQEPNDTIIDTIDSWSITRVYSRFTYQNKIITNFS